MQEWKDNIEKETIDNSNYRKVIYTAKHLQISLMSIKPGEDIGVETHEATDQFFRVEEGKGKAYINGHEYNIKAGDAFLVPCGSEHNVVNTSKVRDLRLYSLYSKPMHEDGEVSATKAIAIRKEI